MGSLTCTGLVYFALSILVKFKGAESLQKIFPSVVVGPVIIIIGMGNRSCCSDR